MRVPRVFFLSFAVWAFLAITVRAAIEIPFSWRGGMIWLQVKVEESSEPLDFLLDSGAGKSVLSLSTARRLGVKLSAGETVQGVQGRSTAYRIDRFAAMVGPVALPAKVLALDLSPVSAGCGLCVDGLLGADFFRSHIVQIDFATQKIHLLSRDELAAMPGETLPLARRNDTFCVHLAVDGNAPQWMRLDTGYSGSLEWVAARVKARQVGSTSLATAGASRATIRTEVLLGDERLTEVKTGLHSRPIFAGESGLVGNGLLSQFLVTVDAAKARLILQRQTQ